MQPINTANGSAVPSGPGRQTLTNHVSPLHPGQHPGAVQGTPASTPGGNEQPEKLLTPGEVALMFRVDPKTVTRWASAGRIGSIRTPGGHRRFRESEVTALLAQLTVEAAPER